MSEKRQVSRAILGRTLFLTILISLPIMLLLGRKVFIGIWCGSLIGMIGYGMIYSMVESLTMENGKAKGTKGYLFRYSFYALAFIGLAYLKVSIVAVLVGYMIHKSAIFLYTMERKDFHG